MNSIPLDTMKLGWFIGDFEPTLHRTQDVEVAIKRYAAGDCEASHYHKIAREFTAVISGSVRMNGTVHHAGHIIVIEPGEAADFQAVTDTVTVVVKLPGAQHDKYLV